ncbi:MULTISPECIES: glycosyltransferase [unclassified Clostridium]|uniref:glycosyltransferase n=1 Tax=unclassified Clostridium TaxID=2614128 RepID=UPI0032175588
MKKSILFVIDSLHCAGAEKSITTLLNLLDYSKYEVDLQLLGYGGALEGILRKEVNLLPPLEYTRFTNLSIKKAIFKSVTNFKIGMLKSRVSFSYKLRTASFSNTEKARIFWQCASKAIQSSKKYYDIAISYAQGVPTFYVADKVKANKKYTWVNVSYKLQGIEHDFQKKYYDIFDNIVAVSESTREIFSENYPEYKNKIKVILDINDYSIIKRMAASGESFEDEFKGLRILTIGRLAYQKGYDIAVEACRMLKDKNIDFRWYVLGTGYQEEEIKTWIKDMKLQENFILLGVKSNPYPFIRDCDIYVQTSKFEGFGLAIAEARMLNKPVVTTRFDAVYNQMVHRKNGLVVDMNSQGIYDGILQIINDDELRNSIIDHVKAEKKGNIEELDKFYNLIEGK